MSIIELFKNILVGVGACRLCIELLNEEQRQVMFGHRGVQIPSSLSFKIYSHFYISYIDNLALVNPQIVLQ